MPYYGTSTLIGSHKMLLTSCQPLGCLLSAGCLSFEPILQSLLCYMKSIIMSVHQIMKSTTSRHPWFSSSLHEIVRNWEMCLLPNLLYSIPHTRFIATGLLHNFPLRVIICSCKYVKKKDKMRRPEFDVFTAPANFLDSATAFNGRSDKWWPVTGDNALKEGTPSIMQISLQNFSHILLWCLSQPIRSI